VKKGIKVAEKFEPRPVLNPHHLYLGDNGRCFCGALRCAGMTAHFTGRDLSGHPVYRITEKMIAAEPDAALLRCEGCDMSPAIDAAFRVVVGLEAIK
jgi:hypothetical protein